MMVFAGRNPMMKNSFKRSLVMVEGTQLQMVGVLDGMMCKELKRKATRQFSLMVRLTVKVMKMQTSNGGLVKG